jgi:hypothetical protein
MTVRSNCFFSEGPVSGILWNRSGLEINAGIDLVGSYSGQECSIVKLQARDKVDEDHALCEQRFLEKGFSEQVQGGKNWRRGWDSNPRYGRPHNGFRGRRLQPLGHLSV